MINATYYEPTLHRLWQNGKIAKVNGKLCNCIGTNCANCDFGQSFEIPCRTLLNEWLLEEHDCEHVDWKHIPCDTKILVNIGGLWAKRYFASYYIETDIISYWINGKTSYTSLPIDIKKVPSEFVRINDCEV